MNFLQSPAWEAFQLSLGREVFRDGTADWSYLAILEQGRGNSRLFCPYGPEATSPEAFDQAITSLKELAKQHSATFIRVEPTNSSLLPYLKSHGWKKVDYQSLNPEHTSLIDLSESEETIIARMDQPARNIYRNYAKKGVTVHQSHSPEAIDIFLTLIHQVAERTGMRPHSDDYFRAQATALLPDESATLWYATKDDRPIAAAITYNGDDTRYYAHAAADLSPEVRKLNAATAIVAEAIVDAKRRGLKTFDLYGIAPDGSPADHPWSGFTKFKRSFGGQDVSFCGSWDLPVNKPAYYLYRLYQKIARI